jgi:hypothetical protein
MINARETGFVDSVDDGRIRGWFYDGGHSRAVLIHVNDRPFACALTCLYREDVVRAGLRAGFSMDGITGFDIQLPYRSGDVVRIYSLTGDFELSGSSPAVLSVDDLVSIDDVTGNPFYEGIIDIHRHYPFNGFRPYFDNKRRIRLAMIRHSGGESIVKILGHRASRRVRAIHEALSACPEIHAPRLISAKNLPDQTTLVEFEFFNGTMFRRLPDDRKEKVFPAIAGQLVILQHHGAAGLLAFRRIRLAFIKRMGLIFMKIIKEPEARRRKLLLRLSVKALAFSRVLSHGDLHCANIMVNDNDDFCIIDWDKLGLYPAGYDLACLLNASPTDQIESLLRDCDFFRQETLIFLFLFGYQSNSRFFATGRAGHLLDMLRNAGVEVALFNR